MTVPVSCSVLHHENPYVLRSLTTSSASPVIAISPTRLLTVSVGSKPWASLLIVLTFGL